MYIVQTAFRSIHGRYYPRGKEVSWLKRQLMAKVDRKFLVTREQYISAYEEEYRREVQERDEDLSSVTRAPRNYAYMDMSASPSIGDAWTPDEDFHTGAHYVPPPVDDMVDPGVLDNATPVEDSQPQWDGGVDDTSPIVGPSYESPSDSTSNNDSYDNSNDSSTDSSSSDASDSSSDSSSGGSD